MQTPAASDPSFKAFLEKLQEQNNRGFASQLVQLKAERENAGEDNDKREKQLDDVILSLKEVRNAVTGNKIDIDLTPLVNIGENQTKLLEELNKEASLTRKLAEGSVEYDKEAAQYRNTSGKDIESKVSGKTSKDGGFIDFETARDTLSGQGKRVREDNAFSLKPINYTPGKAAAAAVGGKGKKSANEEEDINQPAFKGFFEEIKSGFKFFMTNGLSEKPGTGIFQTPSKEVEKKDREADVSSPRQQNPEADNIASTGEIEADAAKSDLEISKQMLDTTKAQLDELKAIREALAPKTPKDLRKEKSTPTPNTGGGGDGGGDSGFGFGLPDFGGGGGRRGRGTLGKIGGRLMTAGKAVLPYAAAAGVAVAGGAAVDYGLGKLGVGKDEKGNDLKVDEKQDDANWAKMTMGQKIQSGVGRGIEKVGSALFLDNMSREAQADRVKNETEYFKDKDFVDSSKEQDEANYKKMSFGKKILSSINRGGEKLSLFDSTKTTAARIRKETEELNKDAPGAATKAALAPTPATVKDQAPGASVEPDITFRRSKRDSSTIGGRVITGFEKGYSLSGKKEDVEEADSAYDEFLNAKDDAAAEAAAAKFKTLATKIQSPEYQEKMKSISKAQQEKKKANVDPAAKEKVTGGPGAKNPAVPTPVVEKKSVDTAAPSKATAVAPIETVDGKKVKPVTDVDKAQQAAKEKYQAAKLEEATTSEKLKAFEKENQFDYREKPTATQAFLDMPGTGKFKDPKKQEEYDRLVEAKYQSSKSIKSAGAEYTAAEGVTKTYEFTGGASKRGDKSGLISDSKKIEGLKRRGYTDKDLGRDDTLTQNFIQDGDAKYPLSNLGKYEAIVKKELDAPIDAKAKSGQVVPNETVAGKSVAAAMGTAVSKPKGDSGTVGYLDEMKARGINPSDPDGSLKLGLRGPNNAGNTVAKTSAENADMSRETGKGGSNNTVVSNNVSSNNTTKIVPMKANPRPEYTGSSLDRYTNRITVY